MHIGFDISQTGIGKAGCGYYAYAMLDALLKNGKNHQISAYTSFGDFYFDEKMSSQKAFTGDSLHYEANISDRATAHSFWNSHDLESRLKNPDIIHSNNFWCPSQMRQVRVVYTLHDIGFMIEPSWSTEANRVGCFNGVFRASVYADWIVAVSKASFNMFTDHFPHYPRERLSVVSPCSRFSDSRIVPQPPVAVRGMHPGSFWLSVGTIEPRKNQRFLAKAYASYVKRSFNPKPLILAGGKGWLMDDFSKLLSELNIADKVILTGYVSDEELVWLYMNCYAHLFPSLFEGFGLPVLEGMQFGTPTIASDTSSIPEVAGNACVLLSPHDQAAWTAQMLSMEANVQLIDDLSEKALSRAKAFNWEKSALSLMDVYKHVVALPKNKI